VIEYIEMEETAMYKVLTKSEKSSTSDKLLCLICNITCLRSNFTTHKNNKKHLMNLQSKMGMANNAYYNNLFKIKKKVDYVKADASESDDSVSEESKIDTDTDTSELEDNTDVEFDDCSANTINLMRTKRNNLIAKQPKYWSDIDKHDYNVIDKIFANKSIPVKQFQEMFNRLKQ
jgi:hypothetical protein